MSNSQREHLNIQSISQDQSYSFSGQDQLVHDSDLQKNFLIGHSDQQESRKKITQLNKMERNELMLENQKKYQRIFKNWLFFDNVTTIFAILGLLLAIVNFELDVNCIGQAEECYDLVDPDAGAMESHRFNGSYNYIIRWVIFGTSLSALGTLMVRQHYKSKWFSSFKDSKPSNDFQSIYQYYTEKIFGTGSKVKQFEMYRSHCSSWLVFEILMLLVFPYPFFEQYVKIYYVQSHIQHHQFLSDYILAFMFMRLFFLFRTWFNYSIYTDPYAKKLCREHGFYPGFRFIFKSKFSQSPEKTVVILFVVTISVLSYVYRMFEIQYDLHPDTKETASNEGNFFNSIYLIIITMTTVGFGDFRPQTYPGKTVIMFTALWGAFMISLLVLTVSNVFGLSKNQNQALQQINISRSAARAISKSFKFYMKKKQYFITRKIINPGMKSAFLDDLNNRINTQAEVEKITNRPMFQKGNMTDLSKRQYVRTLQTNTEAAKIALECTLEDFRRQKQDYHALQHRDQQEMLMTSRILKREVIDMADTMDVMTDVIQRQDQSIQEIKHILSIGLGIDPAAPLPQQLAENAQADQNQVSGQAPQASGKEEDEEGKQQSDDLSMGFGTPKNGAQSSASPAKPLADQEGHIPTDTSQSMQAGRPGGKHRSDTIQFLQNALFNESQGASYEQNELSRRIMQPVDDPHIRFLLQRQQNKQNELSILNPRRLQYRNMDGIGNRGSFLRTESIDPRGSLALARPSVAGLFLRESSRQSGLELDNSQHQADQSYSLRHSPFYQMAVQRGRLGSKTKMHLLKNQNDGRSWQSGIGGLNSGVLNQIDQTAEFQRRLMAEARAQSQFDRGSIPSAHAMLAEQALQYANEKQVKMVHSQMPREKNEQNDKFANLQELGLFRSAETFRLGQTETEAKNKASMLSKVMELSNDDQSQQFPGSGQVSHQNSMSGDFRIFVDDVDESQSPRNGKDKANKNQKKNQRRN